MVQDDRVKEQPIIPQGWTYLVHGSNTGRWNPDEVGKDFTVSRPLCCVTKQDAEQDKRHGFSGSTYTYSAASANPFQIRVLFFKNMINYNMPDCEQLKKELSQETIQDIRRYYSYQGGRHPAVPCKTRLIKIAQTDYDEVYDRLGQTIYWYVPEKYLDMYKESLKKEGKSIMQGLLTEHSEKPRNNSEEKNIGLVKHIPVSTR